MTEMQKQSKELGKMNAELSDTKKESARGKECCNHECPLTRKLLVSGFLRYENMRDLIQAVAMTGWSDGAATAFPTPHERVCSRRRYFLHL